MAAFTTIAAILSAGAGIYAATRKRPKPKKPPKPDVPPTLEMAKEMDAYVGGGGFRGQAGTILAGMLEPTDIGKRRLLG